MRCALDLAITAEERADAEAIDRFRARLLRMEGKTDFILAAAERAGGCPLLATYAAIFWLYAGTRKGIENARPWIRAAAALQPAANDRERRLFSAVQCWAANQPGDAIEILEALTAAWPRDQVAAKICEYQYFLVGQHHEARRFVAHMERIADANADSSDLLAMRAFAHELSGDYAESRRHAERAIALEFATPWAHHALSHASLTRGELDPGIREQEDFLPTWNRPGATIHGHNCWHLAVMHLAAGEFEAAMALLPGRIWGNLPESLTEQTDAISLLWRIEVRGGEAPATVLSEVADACTPLAEDALVPFAAAHHAWVLARAGRDDTLATLLAAAERAAREAAEPRQALWKEIGLPLARASAAAARGETKEVIAILLDRADEIPRIGGSDAQGDLWREALVHALLQERRSADARRVAELFPGTRRVESILAA